MYTSTITDELYDFICDFYGQRWNAKFHSMDEVITDLMKGVVNTINCLDVHSAFETIEEDEFEFWAITDKGRRWLEYQKLREEFGDENIL